MDAENLTFEDSRFDIIVGTGILHHLDLAAAVPELVRVLKPGGVAYFREPLAYHPLINLFRLLTPRMRTKDEHPLVIGDFIQFERHFSRVEATFHHLLDPAAKLLPKSLQPKASRLLSSVDRALLRIVPLRWLAWQVVLTFYR